MILTALTNALRRRLAQRGYVVARTGPGLPQTLDDYLRALAGRGIKIERARIFDGDPEVTRVFHDVFDAQCIEIPLSLSPAGMPLHGKEPWLMEIDIATLLAGKDILPPESGLNAATLTIVRSKLSDFWSGRRDLIDLTRLMTAAGFRLYDVLQRPAIVPSRAAMEDVFLVYERVSAALEERDNDRPSARLYRVSEALNNLSKPIALEIDLVRLTSRGSFGLRAGLLNPGAIRFEDRLLLLARGERTPWPIQKRSRGAFLSSSQPMLLTLADDLAISSAVEVTFADHTVPSGVRFEDFRMFSHQGRVYSNHSSIHTGGQQNGRTPIRHEKLRTAVEISQFEPAAALLTHLGPPQLDRPMARREKNWSMFSTGDRVHLIYSFNPYRMLTAPAFPDLEFRSTIDVRLNLPLGDDGLPFRNSINPISYDAEHLLHVVHKVYPGKQYIFWGVLIGREALLPAKISSRPLLRACVSAASSILYACSAVCGDEDLTLFAGIDDSSIGAWRVARSELDRHWVSLS